MLLEILILSICWPNGLEHLRLAIGHLVAGMDANAIPPVMAMAGVEVASAACGGDKMMKTKLRQVDRNVRAQNHRSHPV